MTSAERYHLTLAHKEPDRIPMRDDFWGSTIDNWKAEGYPPDGKGVWEYFGFDGWAGIGAHLWFRDNEKEYDVGIHSRKDWEEFKHLYQYCDARVDFQGAINTYENCKKNDTFLVYGGGALGFDLWQNRVGIKYFLESMIDDTEWIKDLFMSNVDLNIAVVEEITARGVEFDGAMFYDDLGYKTGPFFSLAMYREQLFPAHKKLCDFLHSKNIKVILHSCGGIRPLMPMLVEAGFDCYEPLEVKAGMDLVDLKKNFGDVATFMGGIDVRAMAHPDPKFIEEEIRTKISVARKDGGYIFHSDHSVPHNVSFKQYEYTIELAKKYGTNK